MLARRDTAVLDTSMDREQEQIMDEEDNQDQELSILKKYVIPNLLQDDFKPNNENETLEPTFLLEDCNVSSEIHEEEQAQNTADSINQQEKRKFFEKDYVLRKPLVNEESFENMTEEGNPVHTLPITLS